MSGTLIVGASHAGVQLAASLREFGDAGPVTMLTAEDEAPYQRPPLSKEFLTADNEDALRLRTPEWYLDNAIDLRLRERAVELAVGRDGSGTAITATGKVLSFRRLALTVGARTRPLTVPGAELRGVCHLRDIHDARRVRARIFSAKHVVVVGGGYIGLEGAAVARSLGAEVTVVEALPRLASRSMTSTMSAFLTAAHERRGTRVLLGRRVVALGGAQGRVSHVVLDDGLTLAADLVLVGIGVEPRTELAQTLGLICEQGIVVDEAARTSHPLVVAAGDCATFRHPLHGSALVRLESVQNAQAQARVAAATLVGREAVYDEVPWFWSDQDTMKIQAAGFTTCADQEILRGDPTTEKFSLLHFAGDRLVGIDAVNSPRDFIDARRALAAGVRVPPEACRDSSLRLRDIVGTSAHSAAAGPEAT